MPAHSVIKYEIKTVDEWNSVTKKLQIPNDFNNKKGVHLRAYLDKPRVTVYCWRSETDLDPRIPTAESLDEFISKYVEILLTK